MRRLLGRIRFAGQKATDEEIEVQKYKLEDGLLMVVECLFKENFITFKHEQCQCGRFHCHQTRIEQSVGVMQGDILSPLLFIMYVDNWMI